MNQILVYLAGPYTENPTSWLNTMVRVAENIHHDTHGKAVCYVPHTQLAYDVVAPKSYEFWLHHGRAILRRCDAVVAIDRDKSPGTESECALAESLAIPVFNGPQDFLLAFMTGTL